MPQLTLPQMGVFVQVDDDVEYHVVTIRHADRLVAEKEGSKYGFGVTVNDEGDAVPSLPQHMSTVLVWAALTRERKYAKPSGVFLRTDCVGLDPEVEDLVLDPTKQEGTEPPSSSATTSHPSLSGSTPPAPVETTGS